MTSARERFFDLTLDMLCTAFPEEERYEHLNPSWQRVLGWTPEELRSRSFLALVHPDDLGYTQEKAVAMLNEGADAISFENRYLHKDGHYVWINWTATVVDGRFYGVGRDVTEQKRQEAALASALSELQHFAYAASHDLREPLRTISSHLGIIGENEELSDESRISLKFVREAAERMSSMLQGLLEYNRLDSSPEAFSRVSLSSMVERVALRFPDIQVEVSPLPVIRAIESQMERLVQNLVSNAQRYRSTERSAHLQITVEPEPGYINLHFRDNGVGIRPGQEERALEIFGRCHARSQFPDGQGVGLALCKRIAERHGGTISLRNNEDRIGLTVQVQLETQPGGAKE